MTDLARFLPSVFAALFLFAPAFVRAAPPPAPVGFQNLRMQDGTAIGIWFPATGTPAPERLGPYEQDVVDGAAPAGAQHSLVVMSHGTGGSFAGHYDTAIALAQAGFVVAALTHPGDNYRDQSRGTDMQARPVALSHLIGFMLGGWHGNAAIDPARVGAFGFSSGGFTVLAAAGGRPDLARMTAHCAAHPGFFDCGLIKAHPAAAAAWQDTKDARIKAIVVAAPALGFAFGEAGLRGVDMPVQLWRADDDHILPAPNMRMRSGRPCRMRRNSTASRALSISTFWRLAPPMQPGCPFAPARRDSIGCRFTATSTRRWCGSSSGRFDRLSENPGVWGDGTSPDFSCYRIISCTSDLAP